MNLYTPKEVAPQFEGLVLVSYPQMASTNEYDGGHRAKFISDSVGVQTLVIDRPIPSPLVIDLKPTSSKTTDSYTTTVLQTAETAINKVSDDIPKNAEFIHSGNSAGALAALIIGLERDDTSGIIALEPTAQVSRNRVASMAQFIKQFGVETQKTEEQKESEAMGLAPFRTPNTKLYPRILRELWGHQNIWKSDYSTQLIYRAIGEHGLRLFVLYAEKSPMANTDEQAVNLNLFESADKAKKFKKYVAIQPNTYHSSMDKPKYFINGLSRLYPKKIPKVKS